MTQPHQSQSFGKRTKLAPKDFGLFYDNKLAYISFCFRLPILLLERNII